MTLQAAEVLDLGFAGSGFDAIESSACIRPFERLIR